ncbi:MAG: carboxypeptidase regulatory-like domain-containing protein [Acidobacteriota bacterium]
MLRFAGQRLAACLFFLLFICLMVLPRSTSAQEFRATVSGTVSDPSGAVVPGAQIEVKEIHSGTISRTTSDAAGQYVVPFLLPGDYALTATAPGFQTFTRGNITLHASDHPVINLGLTLGSTNQTVIVNTAPPQLDLANASVNTTIDTASVANLPLNGRTPAALAELSAGVISTAAPQQIHPFDNNAGNSWSIGGTPNQTSEVLLDGSPDETLLGSLAFSPSQDSVAEVSVQPFATDASFGHTIGGVINQVTKSGTNNFHGTAYEFGQISGIDANLYFNSAPWNKGTQKPLPVFHFNQYGLTFGGPVSVPKVYNGKNKTFFFFAWEGMKDSTPAETTLTVPTTTSVSGSPGTGGEANGDFFQILQAGCPNGIASYSSNGTAMCAIDSKHSSPYADPYQLYDPNSSIQTGSNITRTPIYQNQLKSVYPTLDPVGSAYLKLFPAPNATGTSMGQENYISNAPSVDNYDNEFGRLDFNVGSNDHLFFDMRHNNRGQVKQNFFGNNTTGTTLTRENWGTSLDNVYTLNPTTVFDARVNWTMFDEAHGTPAQKYSPQDVGLPASLATNSTMVQLPYVNFAANGSCQSNSYMCLGGTGASMDPGSSYQVFVDMIKILGKHTLKVGFDGRQYRLSVTNYGASVGSFTFNTSWLNAGSGGTSSAMGLDLAALELGTPSSGSYDLNARGDYHQYYVGTFVQDDWHVSNRLTLNLGLRYDINTPYEERLGKTVNGFNPTAAINYASPVNFTPTTQTVNGQSFTVASINLNGGLSFANGKNGAAFATNSGFFSPRIGFSYGFNDKTVIRGGFGIFVMPETMSNMNSQGTTSSNALSNQEGFSASTSYVESTNGITPTTSWSNPFPNGLTQPAGSSLGANTFLGSPSTIYFLSPSQHDPYSERWNIGVQRSLTSNLMIEALYVGNHGLHLPVGQRNINAMQTQYLSTAPYFDFNLNKAYGQNVTNPFKGTLGATNTTGLNTSSQVKFNSLMVPFPQFGGSSVYEQNLTVGQSWFDSAIIHVEQRMAHGLTLTGNYSFSKMMESDSYLNDQDSFLEHRVSPFDHTHHFTAGGSYQLPFGRGKLFSLGNSRLWDEITGGFVVNGIYQFQSGAPVNFTGDIPLAAGMTARDIKINNRDVSRTPATAALSVATFVTGANPSTCTGVCDGTVNIGGGAYVSHYRTLPSTMSWVRGDGYNNLDASLLKDFHFTESSFFQLRFETFNTLNHPTFAPPNVSNATASTFGTITSTTSNSLPRQIQIGGRLVF